MTAMSAEKISADRKAQPAPIPRIGPNARRDATAQSLISLLREDAAAPRTVEAKPVKTKAPSKPLMTPAKPRVAAPEQTPSTSTALTKLATPGPLEHEALTFEAVRIVVDLGVEVDAQNGNGRTALQAARGRRYNSVVELLVGRGATLD